MINSGSVIPDPDEKHKKAILIQDHISEDFQAYELIFEPFQTLQIGILLDLFSPVSCFLFD